MFPQDRIFALLLTERPLVTPEAIIAAAFKGSGTRAAALLIARRTCKQLAAADIPVMRVMRPGDRDQRNTSHATCVGWSVSAKHHQRLKSLITD